MTDALGAGTARCGRRNSSCRRRIRPPHRLESSATISISRNSWCVALLVREYLIPFEKFTEVFHVLPFSSARAPVAAASLSIWTLKCNCLGPNRRLMPQGSRRLMKDASEPLLAAADTSPSERRALDREISPQHVKPNLQGF